MRAATAFAALLLLGGCVPLPEGSGLQVPRGPAAADAGFALLDPGAQRLVSLHFETHAYGAGKASAASETAEALYRRVMEDTGLYSFMPRSLYPIVVYASREEYLRKTGLPEWSAGAAVGSAIYLHEGGEMKGTLAHEMTHLVFNEFMGRADPALRWINEGLAVYEEDEARGSLRGRASTRPIPFREMVNLAPLGERDALVGDWYRQVGEVTRFMIERGGRVGFGEFLKALRDGLPLDDAVRSGFPGSWNGAAALEAAWVASR
ncbi:MAG: hypothetical protein HY928_06535 [Elusimicrobia bacterium]|nr:hypothetical protein [Elusimicrobiota bacterium]